MARIAGLVGVGVVLAALGGSNTAVAFWPVGIAGSGRTSAPRSLAVGHPRLSLLATDPLRVRGTRFRADEAIRLTARAGAGPRRARAVADRHGAFRATVHGVATSCATITVTAVGASGDRAVTRLPRAAC